MKILFSFFQMKNENYKGIEICRITTETFFSSHSKTSVNLKIEISTATIKIHNIHINFRTFT